MSGGGLYLTDTCDVDRLVWEEDNYNNERPVPQQHMVNVPCLYIEKAKSAFNTVTGEWVKTTEVKIMVPANADIVTGDRVKNIALRENIAVDGVFEIDQGALQRRGRMAAHKTLMLNKIG